MTKFVLKVVVSYLGSMACILDCSSVTSEEWLAENHRNCANGQLSVLSAALVAQTPPKGHKMS